MSNKVPILILLDPSDEQKIIFVVQSIFFVRTDERFSYRLYVHSVWYTNLLNEENVQVLVYF